MYFNFLTLGIAGRMHSHVRMKQTVTVLNAVLAAILAGIMLALWAGHNPADLPYWVYLQRQQATIRTLNTPMPLLGAATILVTLVSAYLRRTQRMACGALVVAALLLVGAGLITRLANQPINAIVMTWLPSQPPADWEQLRDQWWRWHILRTLLGCTALVLLLAGNLSRPPAEKQVSAS
jgi:uncharacterized membrane protein